MSSAMGETDVHSNATAVLNDYLQWNGLRKTPERYAILDAVYTFDGHFTLAMLKQRMDEERHFVVSLATLYNTIRIMEEAGLVVCHRLGGKTEYERISMAGESHFHLVCSGCGKVREFHNERLYRYMRDIKVYRFTVNSCTIYMYGLCTKCSNAQKRKKEKMLKTNKKV